MHEAKAALARAKSLLQGRPGLQLHPEKTRVVSVTEGFEFLGFRYYADPKDPSGRRLRKEVRAKSAQRFREAIRARTPRLKNQRRPRRRRITLARLRQNPQVGEMIESLNRYLEGGDHGTDRQGRGDVTGDGSTLPIMGMTITTDRPGPAGAASPPTLKQRFAGMLVSPARTLAGLAEPDAWFWPAILLLVGYILYYLPLALRTAQFSGTMFGDMMAQGGVRQDARSLEVTRIMRQIMPSIQLFSIMHSAPFIAALSWATRTVCFVGLARLVGGVRAPLGRVVSMIGWAWVPLFFQYAGLGVVMLVVPQVLAFLAPLPDLHRTQMDALSLNRQQWQGHLLLLLSPFVVWNLALCALGVAEVFRLPRWKAWIVVLVPLAAQLLFQAAMYFVSASMLSLAGGMANPGR